MSQEVQILVGGYVFIVMIIVGTLSVGVISDVVMNLLRDWDNRQRKKDKEKYESQRRKTL